MPLVPSASKPSLSGKLGVGSKHRLCPHTLLAVLSKSWTQLKSKDVRRNLGMVSIWRLMEAMLKGSSPLPVITSGPKCHSSAGVHAITRAVQMEPKLLKFLELPMFKLQPWLAVLAPPQLLVEEG